MTIYNQGVLVQPRTKKGKYASKSLKKGLSRLVHMAQVGFIVLLVFVTLVGIGVSYFATSTLTVEAYTVTATTTQMIKDTSTPPVMQRIAQCESSSMQFKNGTVVLNGNSNGTVDIGEWQINSSHTQEAKKLGYDIFTQEGNYNYAMYIYKTQGTGPWSSSAKCWMR